MVTANTFREDLYYRISVIPIELPPLRERAEDISELANHFVQKFCAPAGRTLAISENAMRLLERYSWPGNVRELEHTIERAVALERTNTIEPERLPEKISNYNPYRVAEAMEFPEAGINLTAHLDQLEKTYVLTSVVVQIQLLAAARQTRHPAAAPTTWKNSRPAPATLTSIVTFCGISFLPEIVSAFLLNPPASKFRSKTIQISSFSPKSRLAYWLF
jgi:transcriptional regulator with GAF, ATPase, and Fis domain